MEVTADYPFPDFRSPFPVPRSPLPVTRFNNIRKVTTRKDNESIVQEENCFVEEIKEVELRSRRGKFIYNRTYNPVGLKMVSHFSRADYR